MYIIRFQRILQTLSENSEKLGKGLFNYGRSSEAQKNTFTDLKTPQNCLFPSSSFSDNHEQKSWDTFAFPGRFSIHTGPTPPLTPQTMLDACIQNSLSPPRVGGGRTARKFEVRGNREMTEKYEYCSAVPRTFVQDCRYLQIWSLMIILLVRVYLKYLKVKIESALLVLQEIEPLKRRNFSEFFLSL